MAEATAEVPEEAPKSSKLPLILGLVAALVGGGGGFFATYSGLILAPEAVEEEVYDEQEVVGEVPDVSFVPIEPIVVSIGNATSGKHLRFRAQLEVPSKYEADVTKLLPRVVDILNGYLRAIRVSDIEDPSALLRLRSQMLRRVQVVVGTGRIQNLLIMEFVIN